MSIRPTRLVCATVVLAVCAATALPASAQPTLKGPLAGVLDVDPDTGLVTVSAGGHLTLMGKVVLCGEFLFVPGDAPGTLEGIGVAAFVAADGDVLVSNVKWCIDAEGNGDLEFRWPGQIAFSDGTTVESSGRFVEVPFRGLRGTATLSPSVVDPEYDLLRIDMTGEIVDPDPLD